MLKLALFAVVVVALAGCGSAPEPEAPPAAKQEYFTYIGDYTTGTSQGIYLARFDAASGDLTDAELVAEIENPSFLAIHPNKKFLYAVTETDEGSVSSYAIDAATGKLTLLNTVSANGAAPCDLQVDATGKMLAAANYTSGSVAVFRVQEDGSLSEMSDFVQHEGSSVHERQKGPHAHSIDYSADNRFMLVSDLGMDKVLVYKIDAEAGTIEPNDPASVSPPPGSGPRHFVFHPSGKYAYGINELASTATAYRWDAAAGSLEPIQTLSTLPDGFEGRNSTAEIMAHPSGKFIYGSNRGDDSIAVFSVNEATGELTRTAVVKSGGETPRNFAIDPTGKYLLAAHQRTGNIVVFEINQETGGLTPTGREISVDMAVCIQFMPVG